MALAAGAYLGPYRILALRGAGGMGEVYQAADTRLNRTVAVKVLPQHLSDNPEMRQRFEREAQTIAKLNHPHICTIFDVGSHENVDYIVMEYLEGQTLAQRIERGALALDEALKAATEIVEALDKAHRQHVIHRDLKPSNVMLTKSGIKLLDFGLAKLKQNERPAAGSALPTRTELTAAGTILGTLQYMAPEQLEGQEADARTDIFAFGAMLYEMVAGKKAFAGKSQATLISAIVSAEPEPLAKLQPMTPPALEHAVKTCLCKDPDDRWQTAHDLMTQLRWIAEGGSQTGIPAPVAARRRRRERLSWLLFALATLLVTAMTLPTLRYFQGPPEPGEIRFHIAPPNLTNDLYPVAISPDGRLIAFVAPTATAARAIFVRQVASTTPQQLAGTEGALNPFWSPDSRSIGFFADNKLKKMDLAGGPPQNLCEMGLSRWPGGSWNTGGTIIFAKEDGLYRISAAGGVPAAVTTLNRSRQELLHLWPYFLPDGKRFLYLARSIQESNSGICVGSLDSTETTRLLDERSKPLYADPGYLLFQREGTLFARHFDPRTMQLSGDPVRIAGQIPTGQQQQFNAPVAVSNSGTLVYRSVAAGAAANQRFVWFDRSGKQLGPAGEPGDYFNFDLSTDGKQIAACDAQDIWLMDWSRNIKTRLTHDRVNSDVVWSPDGLLVAFTSFRKESADIFIKKASGLGEEELLVGSSGHEWIEDWSKDGRYIAYVVSPHPLNLWVLPLFGDRKPFPIVESPSDQDEPHFSFDGKWIAYGSNDSGEWQIYVISFPALDQKRQISTAGGGQPRWRQDGKELYYLDLSGKMMAVDISGGNRIESGIPRALFDTGLDVDPTLDQYAVTPDGRRFLIQMPVSEAAPITVVVNWTASLKQ